MGRQSQAKRGTIDRPPREQHINNRKKECRSAHTLTHTSFNGGESHQILSSGEGIAFNCQDQLHLCSVDKTQKKAQQHQAQPFPLRQFERFLQSNVQK